MPRPSLSILVCLVIGGVVGCTPKGHSPFRVPTGADACALVKDRYYGQAVVLWDSLYSLWAREKKTSVFRGSPISIRKRQISVSSLYQQIFRAANIDYVVNSEFQSKLAISVQRMPIDRLTLGLEWLVGTSIIPTMNYLDLPFYSYLPLGKDSVALLGTAEQTAEWSSIGVIECLEPLITKTYSVRHVPAEQIVQAFKVLSPLENGSILVLNDSNRVVLRAIRRWHQNFIGLLENTDKD